MTQPDGYLDRREPQITLDRRPRWMVAPINRVSGQILRPDGPHPTRKHEIDTVQPTPSAVIVAGICDKPSAAP